MDMRALVVDPAAPGSLRLGETPEPRPTAGQLVLDVRHISLNRGEVAFAGQRPPGTVHGYDAAGIVVRAAADGTGPGVGSRVAAFGPGAWAQRMAVDTDAVAEVPAGVDLADAAALPMAGITALRTLRSRPILGHRVLITGAAGGVGRYAVQLATLGGAHVIASVGSPERGKGLAELGAHEVVVGLEGIDVPVDLVLDTVGGPNSRPPGGSSHLAEACRTSAGPPISPPCSPPTRSFHIGAPKTMSTFGDVHEVGPDLATLLAFTAAGRLSPEVALRSPWEEVSHAAQALLDRRISGKAVLDVGPATAP